MDILNNFVPLHKINKSQDYENSIDWLWKDGQDD